MTTCGPCVLAERSINHPYLSTFDAETAASAMATRTGQEPVLDGLDPLMQPDLVVVWQNRHFLTQDDRTAVDDARDVVDRRSGSRQSLPQRVSHRPRAA